MSTQPATNTTAPMPVKLTPYGTTWPDSADLPKPDHRLDDPVVAECRHCLFRMEAFRHGQLDGLEFRAWNHEQANPGHVVSTRVERA